MDEDPNVVVQLAVKQHFPTEFRKAQDKELTDEEYMEEMLAIFKKVPKH